MYGPKPKQTALTIDTLRKIVDRELVTREDLEALNDRIDRIAINAQRAIEAFGKERR